MENERIEQLKHIEGLAFNMVEYLCDLWSIANEDLKELFKTHFYFSDEDLEYFNIED